MSKTDTVIGTGTHWITVLWDIDAVAPSTPPGHAAYTMQSSTIDNRGAIGAFGVLLEEYRVPIPSDEADSDTKIGLLPTAMWKLEMRTADFLSSGAHRPGWIRQLSVWARKLGFAFIHEPSNQITDWGIMRPTGRVDRL